MSSNSRLMIPLAIALAASALGAGARAVRADEADFDSGTGGRSAASRDVAGLQTAISRAYERLFDDMQDHPRRSEDEQHAAEDRILSPAQREQSKFFDDRRSREGKELSARAFHKNGTVEPVGLASAPPKDLLPEDRPRAARRPAAVEPSAAPEGTSAFAPPGHAVDGEAPASADRPPVPAGVRPEYVLDGQDVPRELEFAPAERPVITEPPRSNSAKSGASASGRR